MINARPNLVVGKLGSLHPTQITVGRREVAAKRREWGSLKKKERKQLLKQHWFPVVMGPRQRYYIVDHHHFGLALHEHEVLGTNQRIPQLAPAITLEGQVHVHHARRLLLRTSNDARGTSFLEVPPRNAAPSRRGATT